MATFLLSYRTTTEFAPSAEGMAAWEAWFASVGSAVVEPGNPIGQTSTLGEAVTGSRLGGYSIVRAEDLESAVTLAKGCPVLQHGGAVEVGAIVEM